MEKAYKENKMGVMPVGRLLFSSTLWRRPEFWLLVCMILTLKRNRKLNRIRHAGPDPGGRDASP